MTGYVAGCMLNERERAADPVGAGYDQGFARSEESYRLPCTFAERVADLSPLEADDVVPRNEASLEEVDEADAEWLQPCSLPSHSEKNQREDAAKAAKPA